MSDRFRTILALLLALTLALSVFALSGCTTSDDGDDEEEATEESSEDQPAAGGTMAFYINEPAFIDPVNVQESEGTQVAQSVFDSLVAFDYLTSEIMPAAAESWEPNEDASVWTFTLRDGATFHDGTPVTAGDFKYAWERIANPENESEISYHLAAVKGFDEMQAGEATELEGVVAVDDTTLEVTLAYPFGDFEYVVGHPALAPVPQDAVENGVDYDGETVDFSEMPIGNGPFAMSEPWSHDQYVKVAANEDYYDDAAYLEGVDFLIFTDEETAFLEFQAGNLDFTNIPSGQLGTTKDEYGESADGYTVAPGEQVLLGPETATYYILFNNTDETLVDPTLRAGLSLGIDRQRISDTIFEGTREPATGIVPPGIVGFQDDAWEYSYYDAEAAAAKLEEAGYPGGEGLPTIMLEFNSGSGHEDIMQLIQDDWSQIGVTAELEGTEWAQYLDKLLEGTYMTGRLGWIADYPIMDNFLYPLFTTDSTDNFAFFSNEDVDAKLAEARQTTDADERVSMYQEIEATIGADAPVAPVMFYKHTRVGSDRLRDAIYSPQGLMNFEELWLSE